jgi:DNA repair protein SbcC/Rad50
LRPIELSLSGFRSYAGAATFAFDGRHLVGVVGPIGSGKSSLLDAVAFALYGKTPRVEAATKGLINQRRDEAHVSLKFSVEGTVWKVVRTLRRRGPSVHALYRLEGGQEVVEADRESAVRERIEALLGLDWDGFCRSVMLAQNQFSRFLEARPGERDAVLKGVFGFERVDAMRAVARGRLDAAVAESIALDRLRAQAQQDRRDLEGVRARQGEAAARAATLAPLAEQVAAADDQAREAERAEREAAAERRKVEGLVGKLPTPERAESIFGAAAAAGARVEAAQQAAEDARATLAAREGALAAALEEAGGRPALDEAADLVARAAAEAAAVAQAAGRASRAAEGAQQAEAGFARAEGERAAAEKDREQAVAAAEKAMAARTRATEAVHEAHRNEAALDLRATLEVGATCPVCEQPVAVLPKSRRAGDVARAQKALDEAEVGLAAAQGRLNAAEAEQARARTAAEGADRERSRANREAATAAGEAREAAGGHQATGQRLAALLGAGDPATRLAQRRSGVAAAEEAAKAARRDAEKASRDHAASQDESRGALAGLQALATDLAGVAGGLGLTPAMGLDPDTVAAALAQVRAGGAEALEATQGRMQAATGRRRDAVARRGEALAAAGLGPEADAAASLAQAQQQAAGFEGQAAILEGRLTELGRLEDEERETEARRSLYTRLLDDLAPAKFQKYVLDERRRALAALGSAQFEALSGGRYRFSDDGEFAVVDLAAAEAVRPAASLSGGETFLASLGLALALAEMVAREGGRLDAFFLDEGFGSLDPEHLDLAMEGVERLVAGADRLVVVVSHVPAMRERIEDLIVLGKDDLTGDTVVLAGSQPGT